jgi:hypothetical protein
MLSEEAARIKKQCTEQLLQPPTPAETPSRLGLGSLCFKPFSEVSQSTAAQSPTTALAKLNFNAPPSAASKATGKDSKEFPKFPTTSLDELNFTPCLAKEDTVVLGPGGVEMRQLKGVGGTKRPLSTTALESKQAESSGSGASAMDIQAVMLRSPELRAKRPLVRPNSIAFSSFPRMDLASPRCRVPVDQALTPTSPVVDEENRENAVPATAEHVWRTAMDTSSARGVEQARKSRSLEDIISSPDDEPIASAGPAACQHHPIPASDLFSSPVALDKASCRCRGPSDPHQSSSSISSSGSHNSLHGSLEIIQVS